MDTAFNAWLREADDICEARYGLSIHDLADIAYYDLFEDGLTPYQAAKLARMNMD